MVAQIPGLHQGDDGYGGNGAESGTGYAEVGTGDDDVHACHREMVRREYKKEIEKDIEHTHRHAHHARHVHIAAATEHAARHEV